MKIDNPSEKLVVQDLGGAFQYDQLYTGKWRKKGSGGQMGVNKDQGELQMVVRRMMGTKNQKFMLELYVQNGAYID